MPFAFAQDLTAAEFSALVDAKTVALLPVAAIEQHGPHLPLSTDCDIALGHLAALPDYLDPARNVLVLPLQTIGHSLEHAGFAGVFSHDAETLLKSWEDVANVFVRAGGRRLIVVSSHGGNSEVVGLLNQRLVARQPMVAVSSAWLRFGQPEGLFGPDEQAWGIHGGAVETALMLHYWPHKVRHAALAEFTSAGREWAEGATHLGINSRHRQSWMTGWLNPTGALGDARGASAQQGALSAAHALKGMGQLIAEVAQFDLARLGGKETS